MNAVDSLWKQNWTDKNSNGKKDLRTDKALETVDRDPEDRHEDDRPSDVFDPSELTWGKEKN